MHCKTSYDTFCRIIHSPCFESCHTLHTSPQSSDNQRTCIPMFREMQELHSDNDAVATAIASTSAMAYEHAFERQSKKPRLEEAPVLLGRDDADSALPLKPLHAFIRQQIEVFSATPLELNQPAPGRKQAIQLGQVGIRCRHCSHLPVRNRVKRVSFEAKPEC